MSETLAESTDAVDATDAADASDVSDATAAVDATDVADETTEATDAPGFEITPEIEARLADMSQAQFAGFLQELAAHERQNVEEPEFPTDPFADDYAQQFAEWQQFQQTQLLQQIDQRLAPVQEFQNERVNAQVNSILDETATANNIDPGHREVLEVLANGFASRVQGDGEPAVRQATALAAQQLQSLIKSSEEAAVKRYIEGVQGNADVRSEPGVHGAGLGIESPGEGYGGRFDRVLERHGLARR